MPEGSPTAGVRLQWTRRAYRRIADEPGNRRRRRFFRIKPKIRILTSALRCPLRILARIRDGYVHMMLRLAGSSSALGGQPSGSLVRIPDKEYDNRVLVEIYKTLMAQGQIVVATGRDVSGVSTAQIIARQ